MSAVNYAPSASKRAFLAAKSRSEKIMSVAHWWLVVSCLIPVEVEGAGDFNRVRERVSIAGCEKPVENFVELASTLGPKSASLC
jgi:hypothetical protein